MESEKKRVLFLGAHPDDFESGAAGFFLKVKPKIDYTYLVFSPCTDQPGQENTREEFTCSMKTLGIEEGKFKLFDFPNTGFPDKAAEIRETLEKVRDEWKPDIILTHHINNLHQDHKCITEQVLRVFKTHSILMYEDLKSTPHFIPNLVVSLTKEQLDHKIKTLECYKSQFRRYYHDMDYVRALARVRGKLINKEFGEGFYIYQYSY